MWKLSFNTRSQKISNFNDNEYGILSCVVIVTCCVIILICLLYCFDVFVIFMCLLFDVFENII